MNHFTIPGRGSISSLIPAAPGAVAVFELADGQRLQFPLIGWAAVVVNVEEDQPAWRIDTEVQPVFLDHRDRPATPEDMPGYFDLSFSWSVLLP